MRIQNHFFPTIAQIPIAQKSVCPRITQAISRVIQIIKDLFSCYRKKTVPLINNPAGGTVVVTVYVNPENHSLWPPATDRLVPASLPRHQRDLVSEGLGMLQERFVYINREVGVLPPEIPMPEIALPLDPLSRTDQREIDVMNLDDVKVQFSNFEFKMGNLLATLRYNILQLGKDPRQPANGLNGFPPWIGHEVASLLALHAREAQLRANDIPQAQLNGILGMDLGQMTVDQGYEEFYRLRRAAEELKERLTRGRFGEEDAELLAGLDRKYAILRSLDAYLKERANPQDIPIIVEERDIDFLEIEGVQVQLAALPLQLEYHQKRVQLELGKPLQERNRERLSESLQRVQNAGIRRANLQLQMEKKRQELCEFYDHLDTKEVRCQIAFLESRVAEDRARIQYHSALPPEMRGPLVIPSAQIRIEYALSLISALQNRLSHLQAVRLPQNILDDLRELGADRLQNITLGIHLEVFKILEQLEGNLEVEERFTQKLELNQFYAILQILHQRCPLSIAQRSQRLQIIDRDRIAKMNLEEMDAVADQERELARRYERDKEAENNLFRKAELQLMIEDHDRFQEAVLKRESYIKFEFRLPEGCIDRLDEMNAQEINQEIVVQEEKLRAAANQDLPQEEYDRELAKLAKLRRQRQNFMDQE